MNNLISQTECRNIMLDILTEIDRICSENNITYTLGGGTLLGAVRHHGFIPWDDDIDIFLERSEYERLIQLLKKSDCDWITVLDENTEGYYLPFAKVIHNRTMVKPQYSVMHYGIWVDILPMDNVPDNIQAFKRFLKGCQKYRAIIIAMLTDFSTLPFSGKYIFKRMLNLFASVVGRKRVLHWCNRFITKHNNDECKSVCITWTPYGTEYIEKERLTRIIELNFEGRKFKAVQDYDVLLTRAFGNYLELPPIEKRINHKISAWYLNR